MSHRPPDQGTAESADPVLRYTPRQRAIGHAFVGSVFGAVLGGSVLSALIRADQLSRFLAPLEVDLDGWYLIGAYCVIGALLGVLIEVPRGLVSDARHRRRIASFRSSPERAAGTLGIPLSTAEAEEGLGKALADNRVTGNAFRHDAQGVRFLTAEVERTTQEGRDGSRTVTETIAWYRSENLRFPRFSLQPEGLAVQLLSRVAGIVDVDFPSHPGFSRSYHLSGDFEDEVRAFFNAPLLAALETRQGLQVEAIDDGIAIRVSGLPDTPAALREFVDAAALLFRLFDEAARAAGFTRNRVPPKRDVKEIAAGMPGLIGMEMRRTLVTRADAEGFARQPPPRRVPKTIGQYVERLVPQMAPGFGTIFALVGAFFAWGFGRQIYESGRWLASGDWGGVALGLLFFTIGTPIAFFGWRGRYRVRRLLGRGVAAAARVDGVEPTGTRVNGVEFHRVTVRYQAGGREVRATCRVADHGAERAKALVASGKSASILYDPAVAERILFVEDLISVGPEVEP